MHALFVIVVATKRPAAQDVHVRGTVVPLSVANSPGSQAVNAVHSLAPTSELYHPVGQSLHAKSALVGSARSGL